METNGKNANVSGDFPVSIAAQAHEPVTVLTALELSSLHSFKSEPKLPLSMRWLLQSTATHLSHLARKQSLNKFEIQNAGLPECVRERRVQWTCDWVIDGAWLKSYVVI